MIYDSIIQLRGRTSFPEYSGERVYMREFTRKGGLPHDLSRWSETVSAMLEGIETEEPIYIMIDQSFVRKGEFQRRPGVHIDGYWNPGISAHGEGSSGRHGHTSAPSGHRARSDRGHGASTRIPPTGHGSTPGTPRHFSGRAGWEVSDFAVPEGLILASDVAAAKGYVGKFEGPIGDGGDCSHIDLTSMSEIVMGENAVYAGNVTALHESIAVPFDCFRTLVRLNVPGWTP